MTFTRRSRVVAAFIALISMLFMQLAVAAYACPELNVAQDDGVMVMAAMDMQDQHMSSSCVEVDKNQPNLCHAHDQVGNQSLDKPPVPPVQPFVAVGLAVPVSPIDITWHPAASPPQISFLERATAPPVAIRNCCFRI
jgi:hypothetical protein